MLQICLDHKFQMASWPSGLGNRFVYKRFLVQTLLWSLKFVIKTNLERDTIAVSDLARSWSISIFLLHLNFYQNFKNHYAEKLNITYLVNISPA